MTRLKYKKSVSHKETFKAEIKALVDQGKLKLHRGRIPRGNLGKLLGIGANALSPSNKYEKYATERECIDEFDQFLFDQGHGTVWEERIPEIESYLDQLHKKYELPLQQGRLSRSNVLQACGLPKNQSSSIIQNRAPRLRELFDKYDEIIREHKDNYHGSKYTKYAGAVEELLKSDDIETVFDRTVNINWIRRELGIDRKENIMLCPQIKKHIDNKNREIELQNKSGKTQKTFYMNGVERFNLGSTPYSKKHDRVFSFADLINNYGLEFAEKLGTAMIPILDGYKGPKPYYLTILNYLKWLADNKEYYQDIINELSAGIMPEQTRFEEPVRALYQENVISMKKQGKGSKGAGKFILMLNLLAEYGVIPKVDVKTYSRKQTVRNNALSKPRKSLAEIESTGLKVGAMLQDACKYKGIDIQGNDAKSFSENLAKERMRRSDLPDDLAEAVLIICEERIDEIRRVFTKEFLAWQTVYKQGIAYLNAANITSDEIYEKLEGVIGDKYAWNVTVSELFSKKDLDTATSNLLILIRDRHYSVLPISKHSKWGQFWTKQYQKISSSNELQKMLAPSNIAVVSGIILYLCESGANAEVGRTLRTDALSKSEVLQSVHVDGVKNKAKGKPIFFDLPKYHESGMLSAVNALKCLADAGKNIRMSSNVDSSALMVAAYAGKATIIEEFTLRNKFKEVLQEKSKLLSGYSITPSMIRSTVLLATQLRHPTNLLVAQQVAHHSNISTTGGYVRKAPWRVMQDEKVRKFMNTMTVIMTLHTNIKDASKKLGVSLEEWNEIKTHAVKSGLGAMCKNPFAGVQKDYAKGEKCLAVERCASCVNSITVADPECIADMFIWRESLESAEKEWIDQRPERWVETWMPWLAYFQVVLDEKMSRGSLVVIKKEALTIAQNRKSKPDYRMPEPW